MKNLLRWTTPILGLALCTLPALQAQQGYQQGPPQQQGGYPQQQGYQNGQGYQQGPGGPPPQGGWDAPPPNFTEFGRRGFHDGIEAARRDLETRQAINFNRSPLYRHPPVPKAARGMYRDGFARGYDIGLRHHRGHEGPGGAPNGYYPR